jgi:N-succinyldiaminopimelate aminotransferase
MKGMGQPFLTDRLQGFGNTIFGEMSALALATGSVNLGQGFPDTYGPTEVLEAAVSAIREGRGNQYPPAIGVPELRHAIVAHQTRFYDLEFDADTEVLVTCGATEAIASVLLSLVTAGDEVIAFEPFYDSYAACISMAGGQRVGVTLYAPDYVLDLDALRKAITPRTRMLLLNTPHNPTGKVFTRAELDTIAALAVEHDLLVMADECYEHLVFDGEHIPIATLPGMRERTITVGSGGKTFSVTGWKVGWITSTPELVSAVRCSKQFLTYVSSGPFQYAIAVGLGLPDSYFSAFTENLRLRRDLLSAGLEKAGFDVMPTQGTFFLTADITPLGGTDGLEFCRSLPHRCGVVAVPTQVFYDNVEAGRRLVRFAFCKKLDVLDEACRRLEGLRS